MNDILPQNALYFERKVWSPLRLNRVFDIYYKSDNPDVTVSRVEVRVICNDTGIQAFSKNGVGSQEFSATLFLPTNLATTFSTLTIFTCSKKKIENSTKIKEFNLLPFYMKPMSTDDESDSDERSDPQKNERDSGILSGLELLEISSTSVEPT
ncbi:hypothetical protein RR46_13437 [Papilio xuthus]|uniref:Uncharacterized protein n=1 Tax=Papilio xuthus TaxID=66420 RepID=A0A194PFR0_PAPXU|nr:hypothetical protein RR46_13437 [Papilio xuthus]